MHSKKIEISRVLVANRGAIARRVIRTCQAMGLQTVAVYSPADAAAPYLAEAGASFALPGVTPQESYLNQAALLEIADISGADAVHPGYGFLAENSQFAAAVNERGLTFIGPQPKWLAQMGDKVAARALFADQGFPIFPGSGLLTDMTKAVVQAKSIGYPIMVKPSGGGGGMGMEVVPDSRRLDLAIQRAQAIAHSAFGESGVYLERAIIQPRHVEFQILGDGAGSAIHLYERECSVQRRNQKLIEESPAPGIDKQLVARHAELAAAVCANLSYDNIGTLETLFAPDGEVGFLEMNTRIQVEHAVTEMITGVDLVQIQIELACGGRLPAQPKRRGFAVEARLYAEDSDTLMPSTGRLHHFRPPELHGVRVETGYQQGQVIGPYYDAMLAKIIACGDTREMAIGRLLVALQAFEVSGVKTNAKLLMRILQNEDFLGGRVDTAIVERLMRGI